MKRRNYTITITLATDEGNVLRATKHAIKTAQQEAMGMLRDILAERPQYGAEWVRIGEPVYTKDTERKRITYWAATYLTNRSVKARVTITLEA